MKTKSFSAILKKSMDLKAELVETELFDGLT